MICGRIEHNDFQGSQALDDRDFDERRPGLLAGEFVAVRRAGGSLTFWRIDLVREPVAFAVSVFLSQFS